jgi:hypothetical protein
MVKAIAKWWYALPRNDGIGPAVAFRPDRST